MNAALGSRSMQSAAASRTIEESSYLMVFPVLNLIHWGIGLFCFAFFASFGMGVLGVPWLCKQTHGQAGDLSHVAATWKFAEPNTSRCTLRHADSSAHYF